MSARTTHIRGPRPRRRLGRVRTAARLSRRRRPGVLGQRNPACRTGLCRRGGQRGSGEGFMAHPGLRQRAQPSLLRTGQQGPDRGSRQRQAGPEFALRISAGVRPRRRGCRPLDHGGPVGAAEERRHHHHRPLDRSPRLARRPRRVRHPRRRGADDAPGLLVHQERPHGRICLGREGRREGLRGGDADHRSRPAASQRPAVGDGLSVADRHLPGGLLQGGAAGGEASAASRCRRMPARRSSSSTRWSIATARRRSNGSTPSACWDRTW